MGRHGHSVKRKAMECDTPASTGGQHARIGSGLRKPWACAAVAAVAVILAPLMWAEEVSYPVTVVDSLGRELTFESRPERIVALWNDSVGKIAYVGEDVVGTLAPDVAFAEGVYGPEAAGTVEVIADTGDGPDWEQVLALEPDLVIAGNGAIEAIGDKVTVYGEDWEYPDLDEFFYDVNTLAKVFGVTEQVAARNKRLLDRADAYGIASGRELAIFDGFEMDETGNAWWFNEGGIGCAFIQPDRTCGGGNDIEGQWHEVGWEGLLALSPDVLIVEWEPAWSDPTTAIENLTDHALGQEIVAVKNEKVFLVEKAYARPSHPIVFELYLDRVMPLAYPELFPEPLTDAQVAEILAAR